jgi:hypothetical protein
MTRMVGSSRSTFHFRRGHRRGEVGAQQLGGGSGADLEQLAYVARCQAGSGEPLCFTTQRFELNRAVPGAGIDGHA